MKYMDIEYQIMSLADNFTLNLNRKRGTLGPNFLNAGEDFSLRSVQVSPTSIPGAA